MSGSIQNSIDFVSNQNFIQIQELSAVKKTCCFKVQNGSLVGYVSFKFGQIGGVYFKQHELTKLFLLKSIDCNLLPESYAREIIDSEVGLEHCLECLGQLGAIEGEIVEQVRGSFYGEFLKFILFDGNSIYHHVGLPGFQKISADEKYECLMQKQHLSSQSIGQLVLEAYESRKLVDDLIVQGNCLDFDLTKKSPLIKNLGISTSGVPLHFLLLQVPGLLNYSISECSKSLKSGEYRISNVEFVAGEGDEDSRENARVESQVDPEVRTVLKNRVFRLNLLEPRTFGFVINLFSILGALILVMRMIMFMANIHGAFLDMQPL